MGYIMLVRLSSISIIYTCSSMFVSRSLRYDK